MNKTYLKNKSWAEITREERLFCSHLYHHIREPHNTKEFVNWLNTANSPVKDFQNTLQLDATTEWEAAFEVCFYRDVLKSFDLSVKAEQVYLNKIPKIDNKAVNMIKRTFDLALFSDDTIVIIEAKAAQGLTKEQFADFEMDFDLIHGMYEFINFKKGFTIKPPNIVFIILASSEYLNSTSFKTDNGIGKINVIDKQKYDVKNSLVGDNRTCKIDALISWKNINDDYIADSMFNRAEDVYKN